MPTALLLQYESTNLLGRWRVRGRGWAAMCNCAVKMLDTFWLVHKPIRAKWPPLIAIVAVKSNSSTLQVGAQPTQLVVWFFCNQYFNWKAS